MRPKFSIVIPMYNGEKYIQDTLNSLYNQTFKDFELIIVDGGSTDNSLKVIERNMHFIKTVISEKDEGMYDALTKGFSIAHGEILCYINSDDRLLPNALQLVASEFDKGVSDFVFGDVNYIDEKGEIIYTLKAKNLSRLAISYIRRLPFAQQSCFWSKKVYDKHGPFDKSLKYVADSKFFFSLYLDKEIKRAHIKSALGEYRLHATSFSVGSLNKMKEESFLMKKSNSSLKNNFLLKYYFEFFIKIINLRGIYSKYKYSGAKF